MNKSSAGTASLLMDETAIAPVQNRNLWSWQGKALARALLSNSSAAIVLLSGLSPLTSMRTYMTTAQDPRIATRLIPEAAVVVAA